MGDEHSEGDAGAQQMVLEGGTNGPANFHERDDSLHRALSVPALRRSMTTSAMVMNQDSNAHFVVTASGGLESLDYDEAENDTIKGKFHLSDFERRSLRRRQLAITWVMVITTGFLIGSIAYVSTVAVSRMLLGTAAVSSTPVAILLGCRLLTHPRRHSRAANSCLALQSRNPSAGTASWAWPATMAGCVA